MILQLSNLQSAADASTKNYTTTEAPTTTTSADSTTTTSLCMIDGDCPQGQGCDDNGVCKTQRLLTVQIDGYDGEVGLGKVIAGFEGNGSPIEFNQSGGSAQFFDGTQVTLTAVPTPGADNNPVFIFWNWYLPQNPITITMNRDKTFTAIFGNVVSTTTSANSTTTTSIVPTTTTSILPTTSSTSSSTTSVQPTTSSTTTIPTEKIRDLVREYYLDILDREPDLGGCDYWVNEIERIMSLGIYAGEGFQSEARFFFNSQEYLNKSKTDTQFVTDLYQTFLQREPDQGGLTYWLDKLSCSTRNMLITEFAYADEFKAYMTNIFGPDTSRPENNLLNDFYRGFLNRFPENDGYNSWLALMREAQCTGPDTLRALCHAIALSFVESNENIQRNRNNAEYTEDLYNAILRRGAECAGFQFWVNELNNGASRAAVLQSFTDSQEFQGRVDAVIDAGCFP